MLFILFSNILYFIVCISVLIHIILTDIVILSLYTMESKKGGNYIGTITSYFGENLPNMYSSTSRWVIISNQSTTNHFHPKK